jgi:cell division ATPase FtsA
LPDAHGTGTGDVSEAVTANVAARVIELRVVEYVEELTPDLERLRFRDWDYLLDP